LRSWIEKGRVLVDGREFLRANATLAKGKEVSLKSKTYYLPENIKVLFEDEHLIVLNKPAGLLSVATAFQERGTVHDILKRRFYSQRVYPVHRLDRETSGVMVFAYSELARDSLKKQFSDHSIEREYLAIVEGRVEEMRGTWKSTLVEDDLYHVKSVRSPTGGKPPLGKLAITHFEVVQALPSQRTYLKLRLETGRKNQIRVHCSESGHPILGDKKYGAKSDPIHRLALHAHLLGFVHPAKKKQVSFTSPLPEAFFNPLKIN
jgi:tRNA pseudouridine32 synthase/23S rRNA pseudouridine746 synthase/23S rRNA pseudouridine1911/1915/1917 synthase